MKNLKQLYKASIISLFLLTITSCSKEEIQNTTLEDELAKNDVETASTNSESANSRIASTSWKVQSKGNTYSFTTDVSGRYDYRSNL